MNDVKLEILKDGTPVFVYDVPYETYVKILGLVAGAVASREMPREVTKSEWEAFKKSPPQRISEGEMAPPHFPPNTTP